MPRSKLNVLKQQLKDADDDIEEKVPGLHDHATSGGLCAELPHPAYHTARLFSL